MACQFTVPFAGDSVAITEKAAAAVRSQGGQFSTNDAGGAFTLSLLGSDISGSFLVAGQSLQVTIQSKPFFVPCGTIEGFLKNQLSNV